MFENLSKVQLNNVRKPFKSSDWNHGWKLLKCFNIIIYEIYANVLINCV